MTATSLRTAEPTVKVAEDLHIAATKFMMSLSVLKVDCSTIVFTCYYGRKVRLIVECSQVSGYTKQEDKDQIRQIDAIGWDSDGRV